MGSLTLPDPDCGLFGVVGMAVRSCLQCAHACVAYVVLGSGLVWSRWPGGSEHGFGQRAHRCQHSGVVVVVDDDAAEEGGP